MTSLLVFGWREISRLIEVDKSVNECLISVTGKLQTQGISSASRTLSHEDKAKHLILFVTSFPGILRAQHVSLLL